jgi:hypothetical protein
LSDIGDVAGLARTIEEDILGAHRAIFGGGINASETGFIIEVIIAGIAGIAISRRGCIADLPTHQRKYHYHY